MSDNLDCSPRTPKELSALKRKACVWGEKAMTWTGAFMLVWSLDNLSVRGHYWRLESIKIRVDQR